jgi:hypothetical protein
MKSITIFALLLISIPAFSQKKNTFGVKIGYISSWVTNPDFYSNVNYHKRNMASLGGFYNRSFNKNYSIQVEALYSMKGYKLINQDVIYSYNSDYIELPLLFKARMNGKIKPYINAGFAPAYNISDSYDKFNAFDLGLIGSIGFDISLSENTYTFIELRINQGVVNSHTPFNSNSSYKNASFYALTGIAF